MRAGRLDEIGDRVAASRGRVNSTSVDSGRALLSRGEALLGERPPDRRLESCWPSRWRCPRSSALARTFSTASGSAESLGGGTPASIFERHWSSFRSLRAIPWEQRAEAELRATGETTRKRDPSTLDQLTPQEIQIVGLVADGLTNREIAAQLYLSTPTIDHHLRKVFTKLGIASRTQLVRHWYCSVSRTESRLGIRTERRLAISPIRA